MAENKGILPSSTFNTLGNNSNKWEAVYAKKIVGPLTGNVSGSSSSCTGNSATATNADKLDGYHYTDIINNAKSNISSSVLGAPNFAGAILVSFGSTSTFTTPSNGWICPNTEEVKELINKANQSGYKPYLYNYVKTLFYPVKKGVTFSLQAPPTTHTTLNPVYFIPC